MRKLAPGEILTLRELLQMESNALAASKASVALITDPQLKAITESGILISDARVKGIQQFIQENNVISVQEVH